MNRKLITFIGLSAAIHCGLLLCIAPLVYHYPQSKSIQLHKYAPIQVTISDPVPRPAQHADSVSAEPNPDKRSFEKAVKSSKPDHARSQVAKSNPATSKWVSKHVPAIVSIAALPVVELPDTEQTLMDSYTHSLKDGITEPESTFTKQDNPEQDHLMAGTPLATNQPMVNTHKIDSMLGKTFWQYFNYPRIARKNGWQGQVTIGLRIESNGELTNIRVVHSSGFQALDMAAIDSLKRIVLLDGAAQWLQGYHYDTELPILYKLMDS